MAMVTYRLTQPRGAELVKTLNMTDALVRVYLCSGNYNHKINHLSAER